MLKKKEGTRQGTQALLDPEWLSLLGLAQSRPRQEGYSCPGPSPLSSLDPVCPCTHRVELPPSSLAMTRSCSEVGVFSPASPPDTAHQLHLSSGLVGVLVGVRQAVSRLPPPWGSGTLGWSLVVQTAREPP